MQAIGLCHGDIKSENVLLTSWHWVMLSDFSGFYKPTYLEEANLTTFKFFFQMNKRERCYLAPERFCSQDQGCKEGQLETSMDIFSLGCVLAEIFLDGEALFTYPQLMSYRRGDFDPAQVLSQVKSPQVVELILHMIQLSPSQRFSIDEYCGLWQEKVFPKCFQTVLHPMLKAVIGLDTLVSPDSRVQLVKKNTDIIWTQILGNRAVPDYDTGGTELVDWSSPPSASSPEAILLVIDFLCSSLRNVQLPSNKLLAVNILLSYLSFLSDDLKLHRVLPYFISLLMGKEERSKVKIAALKAVKALLTQVKQLSSNDVMIFDEYIWPSVSILRHDESVVVQAAFAEHLVDFAEIGRVFLELERHLKKEHSDKLDSFDVQLEEVKKSVMMTFKELYSKDNVLVHKALTVRLGDLCRFFERKLTSNHILPLIIPWLSRIWDRRILTLDQIPNISKVIGYSALSGYIYPCMEDGLKEKEEHIVYATLKAIRLIDVSSCKFEIEMFEKSAHLLLHPNQWIKEEMVLIAKKIIEKVDLAENYLRLRPVIIRYLSIPPECLYAITNEIVSIHMAKSLRRKVHESIVTMADAGDLLPHEKQYIAIVSEHMRKTISCEDLTRSLYRSEKPGSVKQYSLGEGNELEMAMFKRVASNIMEAKSMIETRTPLVSDLKQSTRLVESSTKSIYDSPFEGFCPKGRLICSVNEHESAVTSLTVAEDSSFFLSASKDSTVRLWYMKNLQKCPPYSYMALKSSEVINISTGNRRSRLRKVVLFESDSTFAVATDSVPPSIQLYKVSNIQVESAKTAFLALKPAEESAVMGMSKLVEENLLGYCTQAGVLHIYDTREQKDALRFDFGCQRGLPTCLSSGLEGKSLMLGTASGYILLYDLRFNIISRSFKYSKSTPILDLVPFKTDKRACFYSYLQQSPLADPFAFVVTGGEGFEVPVMNLHTGRCGVMFTVNCDTPVVPYLLDEDGSLPTPIPKPPLFHQFQSTFSDSRLPYNEVYQRHLLERIGEVTKKNKELLQAVNGVTQRIRSTFESRATVRSVLCPNFQGACVPYMLTGGAGAIIRYWDLQTPRNSHRVMPGPASKGIVYNLHSMPDVALIEEAETEDQQPVLEPKPMTSDLGDFTPEWKVKHLDDIVDMALGYGASGGMLISAGRDGSIRLWN